MEFFYSPLSGNSARVAFALHEAGVPYTPHALNLLAGETRSPAYLAINPMGKVPALIDGAVHLWESNAINWYLAETHPASRLLPDTPAGRASVQRWLMFQAGQVTPACVNVYRVTNARVRAAWKVSSTPEVAEAGRKELARFLPVLEEALGDRPWLEGDAITLADIAYAPHLWFLAEGGFDCAATPRVRTWLERLLARPAWQTTREMLFGA
jgi:glutathione S-transferase